MPVTTMSKMTAPSSAYRIVNVPEAYKDIINQHGRPGIFVGPSETESPWVPFGPNAAIRHLHFDTRHNIFSNIFWVKA
jgi:2,4'-dihydroxyacetophenone dioxygenase